jgi:hypothetical protein
MNHDAQHTDEDPCRGRVEDERYHSLVPFGQIKAELPQLIKDIEICISSCCRGLENLGPARVTLNDQKGFLVDISDDFQTICKAAIKGDYKHRFFVGQYLHDRRLSSIIANWGMDFAGEIRTEGAKLKIVKSARSQKRYCTRAGAVEEVRKLLRKSRGCEVRTSVNIFFYNNTKYSTSYQAFQIQS